MTQFDIIVIGAGPAGSSAATWAAKQGRSVALIDKATFPRNKLCGGLFTERSRTYYHEIFGQDVNLAHAVTREEIAFWHDGRELAVLSDIPPLHLTMRLDLDSAMFAHALDAGVEDFTGQAIAALTETAVKLPAGTTLTAAVIIGSAGVNSLVARQLFGKSFAPKTFGFGPPLEAP